VLVDGRPGISVIAFTVVDGRIVGIAVVSDPAKLSSMELPDPA
jgi:RNA polymerase sigma-70 factor (ECF subfamily)